MANSRPGSRLREWWAYESPEPRDETIDETLQLYHMDELKGEELNSQKEQWALGETRAARSQWFCAGQKDGKVTRIDGKQGHLAWRRFYSIPDDLFPPKSAEELSRTRTNKKLESV